MSHSRTHIAGADIDRSRLVGREIKIQTQQFPGRMLLAKVIGINGNNLVIDGSDPRRLKENLISNQAVEVHLDYKGEPVAFNSNIFVPGKGGFQIPIAQFIFPEVSREFPRFEIQKDVRLTYFDAGSISSARLSKHRWIETQTIDIGGGGVLLELPEKVSGHFYLILHLGLEGIDIPDLLVGRIRHCRPAMDGQFFAGVEFIVKEDYREKLPGSLIRNLPPVLFRFDDRTRSELAVFLMKKYG